MQPKFNIGDKVTRTAFIDASGNHVDAIEGLIVTRIRLVEPSSKLDTMKPYYRVLAENGGTVEGAERFFASVCHCGHSHDGDVCDDCACTIHVVR